MDDRQVLEGAPLEVAGAPKRMRPPPAGRIRRPSWRDPKLGIGLVLMALAVALGMWAVAAAGRTVPVWAASKTLTPGDELQGNVVAVQVSPETAKLYIAAQGDPNGKVDRVVGQGEPVPMSALGAGYNNLRSVMVPSSTKLPGAVQPGARVDVWLNPKLAAKKEPIRIAENALVGAVSADGQAFSVASYGSVELLVGEDQVSRIVSAIGDGGSLVVVPRTS